MEEARKGIQAQQGVLGRMCSMVPKLSLAFYRFSRQSVEEGWRWVFLYSYDRAGDGNLVSSVREGTYEK